MMAGSTFGYSRTPSRKKPKRPKSKMTREKTVARTGRRMETADKLISVRNLAAQADGGAGTKLQKPGGDDRIAGRKPGCDFQLVGRAQPHLHVAGFRFPPFVKKNFVPFDVR